MSIVICLHIVIKIYQKVQGIGPVSLFPEFEPQQNIDQSQMAFDNLLGYILSISMCLQNFITIFHSLQAIRPFSLFQNLVLGKASTDDKCHFAMFWDRSCQYQCVCKSLSKYSKRFKSCGHFSLFVRGQNLHKLPGDKIKCFIIGHTLKVNFQLRLTFLGSCNCMSEARWRYYSYLYSK